jgi:HAD superfamily hydrolase (TIGR01509 family)
MISAIIFDMDGLMFDTEPIAFQAWNQALSQWDLSLSKERYLRLVGRSTEDAGGILRQEFGSSFAFEDALAAKTRIMLSIITLEGVPFKPGLLELLDELERRSLVLAVASSSSKEDVAHLLKAAKLGHRFGVIVGGDEVAKSKPFPDIFLLAAGRLGVSPGDCLVLEDSDAGVHAALQAGMSVVMIPDLKPPPEEIRTRNVLVLPSLSDVIPHLGGQHPG